MFTLNTAAGNRTGVMSRLATTLNTLTLVKQSSCYYALVKTVATQIQSPFGFVGTRHMKGALCGVERATRATQTRHVTRQGTLAQHSMDSQMSALVRKSHTIAPHAAPVPAP